MISRRPHILKYSVEGQEPYQDENGNWVFPDAEGFSGEVPCRVEPNKSQAIITTVDGTRYEFEFIIYAEHIRRAGKLEKLPIGASVEVFNPETEEVMAKGNVADFANDQRQMRIWI